MVPTIEANANEPAPGTVEPGDGGGEDGIDTQDDDKGRQVTRKTWSAGEGQWHSRTVDWIADNPYSVVTRVDPVVVTWRNSVVSRCGKPLWNKLLSQRRPDVVFRLESGRLVVVEIEPYKTRWEGVAQLVGDYLKNFDVQDLRSAKKALARGVLVCEKGKDLEQELVEFLKNHNSSVVYLE